MKYIKLFESIEYQKIDYIKFNNLFDNLKVDEFTEKEISKILDIIKNKYKSILPLHYEIISGYLHINDNKENNTFIIKKNDDFYYFKYRYLKGKDIYVYCFKCDQISGINKLVNSKELKYNGNTFS